MPNQIKLAASVREEHGKGPTGRLRKQGRVPAIVYGFKVDPTPVSVDSLELYHALHTEAGLNALIALEIDGDSHLTVARDLQYHPIRGDMLHVDFLAVDTESQISVDVPVHLANAEEAGQDGGVTNQILYSIPILVRPLDVPNYFELDIAGMEIGDVRRVEDLAAALPDGAEFEIEGDRTVVTINAPISEEALEAMEAEAGVEAPEPELAEEAPEVEAGEAPAEEAPAEGEEAEA